MAGPPGPPLDPQTVASQPTHSSPPVLTGTSSRSSHCHTVNPSVLAAWGTASPQFHQFVSQGFALAMLPPESLCSGGGPSTCPVLWNVLLKPGWLEKTSQPCSGASLVTQQGDACPDNCCCALEPIRQRPLPWWTLPLGPSSSSLFIHVLGVTGRRLLQSMEPWAFPASSVSVSP